MFHVDDVDDFKMPRQHALQQVHGPPLQCFREDGVVGIGARAPHDTPSAVPLHLLHVNEDPHELRDGQRWMGVVKLDRHLQEI